MTRIIFLTLLICISKIVAAGYIEEVTLDINSKNYAKALSIVRAPAEQGDASAQHVLGYLYQNGLGVEQNSFEAVKWYRLAANQEFTFSQRNLGFMYANGFGVTKDEAEAIKWYKLAANKGDAQSQINLGDTYKNSIGLTKDDAEAVKWYRLAANQGLARGQFNLGFMYQNGFGVSKDHAEAVKWYRLAANQGLAQGQFNLGFMYQNGLGVPKDDPEATKWYKLAANQGLSAAGTTLVSSSAFICSALIESRTKAATTMAGSFIKELLLIAFRSYSGASYRSGTFTGSSSSGPMSGTYTLYDNSWLAEHYSKGLDAALNGTSSISDINSEIERLKCEQK